MDKRKKEFEIDDLEFEGFLFFNDSNNYVVLLKMLIVNKISKRYFHIEDSQHFRSFFYYLFKKYLSKLNFNVF